MASIFCWIGTFTHKSQSKGFTKFESEPGMNRKLEVTLVMCAGKEYSTRRSFVLFVVKPWETPS